MTDPTPRDRFIAAGQPINEAVETNLLEEVIAPVTHHDHQLVFGIKPFEIKTFKLWF